VRLRLVSVAVVPGLVLGYLLTTSATHHQSVRVSTDAAPHRASVAIAPIWGSSIRATGVPVATPTAPRSSQLSAAARSHRRAQQAQPVLKRAPAPPTTVAPPRATTTLGPPPVSASAPSGCTAAVAYLRAHAAPGFTLECPGDAEGHQGMTCVDVPGICPGAKIIAIAIPCPASWMNEASNSWVLTGRSNMPLDPYGYCH
jgi:hypothetical protein